MTTWMPVINGVECGCMIDSADSQATFENWRRCQQHQNTSFKEIKKISIDENLVNLELSGECTQEEIAQLRASYYLLHGIEDGL